jgi:hypothetical protein
MLMLLVGVCGLRFRTNNNKITSFGHLYSRPDTWHGVELAALYIYFFKFWGLVPYTRENIYEC